MLVDHLDIEKTFRRANEDTVQQERKKKKKYKEQRTQKKTHIMHYNLPIYKTQQNKTLVFNVESFEPYL